MKEFNNQRCCLFYGKEGFLLSHWRKSLVETAVPEDARDMNMDVFEGKVDAARIIESAETQPFMAERRLVVVTSSGLFQSGRKDDAESMANFVKDIPESTVMLFIEQDVDKRGKLYKSVVEHGLVKEAATPKEAELVDWAVKLCASFGAKLPKPVAVYLIRNISADMQLIYNEVAKLASYKGSGEISNADVDTICTKSLEAKIFDLMKAIGNRDAKRAAALYGNLIAAKESPLMVLTMIARQFRYYLQCAHLSPKISQKDIAAQLSLHPFAVREFVEGTRNFSQSAMISALENCLETDFAIKTGQIGDVLGVEVLLIRICNE